MNPTSDQLLRIVWSQFWQVSLLIVLVGGIAHTVCRRRPHMAHLLWILVLVKCLTPPVWSSRLGVFSWAQAESVAATTAVDRFDEEGWLLGLMFSEGAPVAEAPPEVQFAAAMDDSLFEFKPGDVQWTDETSLVLKRLRDQDAVAEATESASRNPTTSNR